MEAAGTIRIKENHNNQSNPVETVFSTHIETMPSPVINHIEALALRQGEGWSDEQKRRMCKLDLERRVLILPNGQEYPIDEFDWTETRWDEENGLTLQYKGPRELSHVNLLAAGSSDIFDEKLLDAKTTLEKKKRKHIENGIEWLKQSIKLYDENKINAALVSIQSYEGITAFQSSMVRRDLEKPPKNRLDLEKLRQKKKRQRNALTPKSVTDSIEGAAELLTARQGYENKVQERIQAIHKRNPLSARYVRKSRAKPETYSLEKHTSSKKKQALRDEIRAANHLDKTVLFQLLEDPKQGLASPVKNAAPNGLELLQEYNQYVNQQDFANQTEQQNVAQYVASITTEFKMNPNIHPYYANQWNFERAIEAVTRGEILSKQVNGIDIIGASEYIQNLKQVDCPPISDDSLAGLRQADEYHWVTYLRSGLAEASAEGMAEVLEKSLPLAQWMQKSRYGNLKRAEMSLDLETTSEEANKIVDDMDIVATPLPWSEIDEKPTVGKDGKTKVMPDGKLDPKAIMNKSDEELALDAGGIAEKVYKNAIDTVDRLIASTDDPVLQKRYREAAANWVTDLAKQTFEINKQDKAIQNQWQKLEELVKVMDSQRWKDLWRELFLLWLKSSVEGGSKGVQKFMAEFEKIVAKAISG